ncbi:hypothetical protein GGR34_001601 [Microvirga flocculans]|uniref:Uncharacterized protein n=1 Tax=Microvirga flocculans TaxID=217168 RepID=A0A7W6IEL2_9HYPH|nr:hypothetical protein [Microvirga flocculans]MBB4039954.1 hypothetical protein [Microvirga flocculans]
MTYTSTATGTFSSRREANRAVQRLVSAGFARNSIAVHPHEDDEGYDLEIHTRRKNHRWAERLIHASDPLYPMRQTASMAVETARSYPLVLLGAGVLAGFLVYSLIPHQAETSSRSRRRSRS